MSPEDLIRMRQMHGMRNRLTHGCFDVDLDCVWDTGQEDLGPLRDE